MDSFCSKSYSTNIDRQRHHIVKLVITFFCHLIRLNLCINRLQRYKKFWKVIRIVFFLYSSHNDFFALYFWWFAFFFVPLWLL